jgi:Uma2 family endonuclease
LPEPELHLEAEDPIVPDIAGWRQERLSFFPRGSSTKIPPDWVCEVLSPKTEKLDRSTKMEIYADAGVGHIWLVEPIRQQLEVFVLAGRQYRRMASRVGEEVVNAAPFDSLALELSELWPPS